MTRTAFLALTAIVLLVLSTCATTGGAGGSGKADGPAFTGDGGKGISLTILPLRATGLADNQGYVPTLVQGEFVSNFTSYSAITPLDRISLERQYSELLSGYYSDNAAELWDLGHLPPTTHIMIGSITRTSSGYALQVSVNSNADKTTVASYSSAVTIAELDNLSGVRRASLDLMQKLGVQPTARTRDALSGAAAANEVNAQRALSQGIIAQRQGDNFDAMMQFFSARSYGQGQITEAATRMASLSGTQTATTANDNSLRGRVMGEIERQREAIRLAAEKKQQTKALLDAASAFYRKHHPFEIFVREQFGVSNINIARETVQIRLDFNLDFSAEDETIIRNLAKEANQIADYHLWPFKYKYSLFRLGKPGESGGERDIPHWVEFREGNKANGIWQPVIAEFFLETEVRKTPGQHLFYPSVEFKVTAELVNENGKALRRFTVPLKSRILSRGGSSDSMRNISNYPGGFFHLSPEPKNRDGTRQWGNYGYTYNFTANVNDLTDTMTLRIVSIDGKSINNVMETGYVKINPATVLSSR